jgi:hypothetical protein
MVTMTISSVLNFTALVKFEYSFHGSLSEDAKTNQLGYG